MSEQARPGVEMQLGVALACRQRGDAEGAFAALDAALAQDPKHLVALLSKASLIEQVHGARAAVRPYRAAVQVAPEAARLPPGLNAAVRHGRDLIEADAAALRAHLLERTAALRGQHPQMQLARFDEGLDIFAGTARPQPQRPMLLYYPRLPAIPFHDRGLFPFLQELEAATPTIQAELHGVLASAAEDFAPYIQFPATTAVNQWGELNHSRRWNAYYLWRDGVRQDAACARCPHTAALAERLPLMRQQGFAPTVMFSALEPHTTIPPHTGSANTRLLVHLPLILPAPRASGSATRRGTGGSARHGYSTTRSSMKRGTMRTRRGSS